MRKAVLLALSVILSLTVCACANYSESEISPSPTISSSPSSSIDNSTINATKISFTNKYGTSTTKCAHSSCNNYIASSGDTNCCTTHSNRCSNCECYIDEDALFCMACLEDSLG